MEFEVRTGQKSRQGFRDRQGRVQRGRLSCVHQGGGHQYIDAGPRPNCLQGLREWLRGEVVNRSLSEAGHRSE